MSGFLRGPAVGGASHDRIFFFLPLLETKSEFAPGKMMVERLLFLHFGKCLFGGDGVVGLRGDMFKLFLV